MVSKSTAERCKKNTSKNIKKYIEKKMPYEKETIAKKWKLIQLLTEKGYEFSERKQKYRQRVKESIATATAANLETEQNDDSAFAQAYIRSRTIQKVAKTLPKSPRKRKEVIPAFANEFKLRIQANRIKSRKTKKRVHWKWKRMA